MSYIAGKPIIKFTELIDRKMNGDLPFPLGQENCYFYFSARYALAAGLEALRLKKEDIILLPSYNCGAEVDPVVHSGRKAAFYRIGRDLQIDIDDLEKRIHPGVKVVVVTHFLGFPQEMEVVKNICRQKKIYLVEDCAHAFLGACAGRPLGSQGDIAIFSLLKTLPVPNGGTLVINSPEIFLDYQPEKPNSFAVLFYAAQLLKQKTRARSQSRLVQWLACLSKAAYDSLVIVRLALAGYRKYIYPQGLFLVKPDSHEFVDGIRHWGISGLSRRILKRVDFVKIREIRRRNFKHLLDNFLQSDGPWALLIKDLPPGICPLFFPLLLESPEKRKAVYQRLKSRGVISHPWWDRFHPAVPWEDFPEAVYLKNHLLGLPCHQDLGPDDLDFVFEEFQSALAFSEKNK